MMWQNISRYILFINHECKMDLCLCIQVLRLGKDYLLFGHKIEIIMHEHYHKYQYYNQCHHDNLVITLAIAEG